MRPRTLLALLLVVPFVDALFLIYVAAQLGVAITVALVVLTAIIGMLLLRAEGRATLVRMQRKLARGEPPTDELLDGGLLIAAGALLLTPGLVTDAIGFLLALPLSRVPIRMALKRYVVVPYIDRETDGFVTGNVYIGGFPGGDTNGFDDDFGGVWSGAGPDDPGPDDPFGTRGGGNGAGTSTRDRFDDVDRDDEVIDVEYSVEDERRRQG